MLVAAKVMVSRRFQLVELVRRARQTIVDQRQIVAGDRSKAISEIEFE
jgi:hypothetical protein